MRITLAELELHRVVASESFAPGTLDYHGAEFTQTAPLAINVIAELTGGEIRIWGHLATAVEADCDRCLGRVKIPVDHDFDLIYRPVGTIAKVAEVEIPADELEIGFYSGDGIEMADVATEQVILALPLKVVCRADCQGLCPVCRVNRNLTPCDCAPPAQDSPFAALR